MYSIELKTLTRDFLKKTPLSMMKNSDGTFGVLLRKSMNEFNIIDLDTKKKYHFNSIDEVVMKGWVVD